MPDLRGNDPEIVELHLLLLQLGIECMELGAGRVQSRLCLIQFLLADHLRRIKAAGALVLLLRVLQICQLRGFGTLLAGYGRLLLDRVDLH